MVNLFCDVVADKTLKGIGRLVRLQKRNLHNYHASAVKGRLTAQRLLQQNLLYPKKKKKVPGVDYRKHYIILQEYFIFKNTLHNLLYIT